MSVFIKYGYTEHTNQGKTAYGAEGNTPKEAGCEPSKGSDVTD